MFTGNGSALTALNATNVSSGTLAQIRLANASTTLGSTALTLGSTVTAVAGLTSTTFSGATSGTIQLIPAAIAGTGIVLTMPATTGTVVTTGDTGTVTNTMLAGSITNAKLANSSVTLGSTALTLGATVTTVAGLNSVTSTTFVGALTGNASGSATKVQVDVLVSGTNYLLLGAVGAGVGQTPMTYSTLTYTTSTNILTTNISGNVITTGANTTAGTITGNWSLSAGSKLNATYADLAEKYVADREYSPGTVLVFGGEQEITLASTFNSTRVAGVVTTNPAYTMNNNCEGEHVATIALQGRVPVKVSGNIAKGDLMVSGANGRAIANNEARAGTIIGKSLENFTGTEGTIEVAVGRF